MSDQPKNPKAEDTVSLSSATSSRGRSRLYESNSEKLEAFRQRHKEGGFLRKEVLVQADVAERINELAKQLGTSTLNVSSGLLELGLKTYEVQHLSASQKAESRTAGEPAAMAQASAAAPSLLAGAVSASALRPSVFRSMSPAQAEYVPSIVPALSVSETTSAPAALEPAAPAADPIQSFFASRKRVLK